MNLIFDVSDLTGKLPEATASVDLTLCLYSILNHLPIASLPKIPAEVASAKVQRGDRKGGSAKAIFAVMGILFLAGTFTVYATESGGNPAFAEFPVDATPSALQAGGNMEGKEVRFGIANSSLFTTITTDASCGAVNTMHDSLLALAGMVPMVNIMLGEIIFGGVGSGLYGMLLFAIVAVFVAGLMVGRTPEYLGKKIEAREVKMAILAILILPLSILGFTALAVVVVPGLAVADYPSARQYLAHAHSRHRLRL